MTRGFRLLALGCFLLSAAAPLLAAPIEVGGVVLDSSGKPLSGATADLLPVATVFESRLSELEGVGEPRPVATATTGADGRFRFQAPGEGFWTVRIRAKGYVPRQTQLAPLFDAVELADLQMEKGAPLKLRLVDSQGRPVSGARVVAAPGFPGFSQMRFDPNWAEESRQETSGADGSVTLVRGSVPLEVTATASGFNGARMTIARSGPAPLRLESGCAVTAEVLDREKRPVAGALVSGDGALAKTGTDGRAAVTVPCGRTSRLRAELADGRLAEATLPAKRVQGEPVRLALPAQPASLSGRVLEEGTGKPVAGAFVWSSADPGRAVRSDGNGRYTLTVPTGVKLYLQAAALNSTSAGIQPGAEPVPGSQEGPAFALPPASLAGGTVVDEAGRPVAGAQIQAAAEGRFRWGNQSRTRSGPQGGFRLRVPSGQAIQLIALHPDFSPASVPLPEIPPHASRTDLRLVLKRGLSATGTVRDQQEKPVAGAQITLVPTWDDRAAAGRMPPYFLSREKPLEAISGADGRFTIEHLQAGRFDLVARAAGFAPVQVPGLEIQEGAKAASLGTVILHPGLSLTGTVVDPKDRPIAGATVQTGEGRSPLPFAPPETSAWTASTGPDGRFALSDLAAGQRLRITVSQDGYASRTLSGIELPSQPLRVVLSPAGRIAGRVVDEEGNPLRQAFLEIGPSGSGPMFGGRAMLMGSKPVVTNEAGEFEFRDIEPGTLTMRASAQGYRSSEKSGLEVPAGGELTGVELVLRKGAVVAGQVLGPDGKPVSGAVVELAEGGRMSFSRERASSDGEGRYRIEGVEPGPRAFSARHEDFPPSVRDLEVQPGENRLDFRLAGGYPVAGRAIDGAGQPVAEAELMLFSSDFRGQPKQERSAADGSFRFENVGAGTYTLNASHEGYSSTRRNDLEVRGPVTGLEVKLDRGGAIRGRILGVALPDLQRLSISAISASGGGYQSARADYQGQYRIDNVSAGEWKVIAELDTSGEKAEGKVVVEEGAEAVLDLDLKPDGLTLSGRVTRRGEPVGDVRVLAESTDPTAGGTGLSNYDGLFRITGLEPGTYQISTIARFARAHHQTVELASDQEIAIELPDSRVAGRVVDAADSSPLEGATISAEPADGTPDDRRWSFARSGTSSDSAGNFTLTDLGAGTFRVIARKEGYSPAETTIDTGDGNSIEGLRLALSATQGLTLQVVSSAGTPSAVDVALLDPSGRAILTNSYPVTEGGRARISEAPPGRWTLLASSGGATSSLEVTVPGPAVAVTLLPATALRVTVPDLAGSSVRAKATVLGANGQPYRLLGFGGYLLSEWIVSDGQILLNRLPPGTWQVVVTAPDGHTWKGTAATSTGVEAAVVLK